MASGIFRELWNWDFHHPVGGGPGLLSDPFWGFFLGGGVLLLLLEDGFPRDVQFLAMLWLWEHESP